MTNYDKLRAVEISGARLFEHLPLIDMAQMLERITCDDCPCRLNKCRQVCSANLADWLEAKAK